MRLIRLFRTSTFRLALIYMALFGASVLILMAFIYWATAGYLAQQIEATIQSEVAELTAEEFRQHGLAGLIAAIKGRITADPRGPRIYLLTDSRYRPLAGNLERWPAGAQNGWVDIVRPSFPSLREESHPFRVQTLQLPGAHHLLVGQDAHQLKETQEVILRALGIGLAITFLLALIGGTLMSVSTVRRIEAINRTSREIMTGDLTRRMPTAGTGDDFDQLADNLNAMLERIEALMAGLRQVSDNIAHDLRTPLSRLRARLELTRMNARTVADYEALIEAALNDVDAILGIFTALLRIAQIEAGSRHSAFAAIDLAALIEGVVELYEPVAEDAHQSLELAAGYRPIVPGDRDLLFQMFANLLDNAIKYTPPGGRIRVELRSADGRAQVVLADSGPGIPPEASERVFQRFFRLESSRSSPGSGLGLSLVAAVAKLHGIELRLEDNRPGLRVLAMFPQDAGTTVLDTESWTRAAPARAPQRHAEADPT